jgi:hypothetical protein
VGGWDLGGHMYLSDGENRVLGQLLGSEKKVGKEFPPRARDRDLTGLGHFSAEIPP